MTSDKDLQEALANCDCEPIHTPGAIQSFGALIALDKGFEHIEFASHTTEALLGTKATDLLQQPIGTLLDSNEAHLARNCLSHRTISEQREVIGEKEFSNVRYQMSVHQKDDRCVLEFLPLQNTDISEVGALEKTRALLAESVAVKDFQTTLETAVESLRASTGYDRVKAYRFLPDGTGEVVAESRAAHTDSFLGLRYPASDVPPVARKLYTSTPIRVIADIDASDTPIAGIDPNSRPLDLSLAVLRGTASVHLQYMRNMGVKSTLTLPIVVMGELWGLFAMHHMKPLLPDPNTLISAELSGKMLSLIIQHTTQTRQQAHLSNCTSIANELLQSDDKEPPVNAYWNKNHSTHLRETISSDGIAYIADTKVQQSGSTPNSNTCLAIRDLASKSESLLLAIDNLQASLPEHKLADTGGALVIPVSQTPDTCVILFRNLTLQNIKWAGVPEKEVTKGKKGIQLNPRQSFSRYAETVSNKCDEWTNDDIEVASVLKDAVTRSLNLEAERRDSRHRLRLMIQELNHRVKNILTLVQSLSASSKTSATSIESYAVALEQRIIALAGAHDLLTKADMRGIKLEQIAALELQPYLIKSEETLTISGPEVVLNADASPIMALVLHELTSNAVKHGSLSQPGGTVTLSWEISSTGLEIQWGEKGGPVVCEPKHEGFGRSIIENAIEYEFEGKSKMYFDSDGLRVELFLPASEFQTPAQPATQLEKKAPDTPVSKPTPKNKASLKRILIVEDNFIIAREAKLWFEQLGFEDITAVATVKNALEKLSNDSFDFCLLDVNLRGEMSEPIANKLTELGTSYAFSTGYGSDGLDLCNQYDAPCLTKPINLDILRTALTDLGIGKW